VKVLSISRIKTPKQVAKLLKIKEGEEVVQVKRTRNTNNSPVSYIINYLPLEIGEKIKKEDLCKYPMLQILRDQFKIPLQSGIQYIEPIVSDHDISSALSVSLCSPILFIETTIFAKQKKPIEFVQTYIRPDRYKYSVKLSVKKGPGNEVRMISKQ
jgi:GntR family transcriptional regulator